MVPSARALKISFAVNVDAMLTLLCLPFDLRHELSVGRFASLDTLPSDTSDFLA